MVAALRAVPQAATHIVSPLSGGAAAHGLISADGRSELVTFNVAGDPNNADQLVGPALHAVAAVQARHPGLRVTEAGGASFGRVSSSLYGADFHHA